MKPIIYRDFTIQPSEGLRGKIEYFQEGEVTRFAESVEEAKVLIDEEWVSQLEWKVETKRGVVFKFQWIEGAIKYCSAVPSAKPLFSFDSM
jgi:hypothetical protein